MNEKGNGSGAGSGASSDVGLGEILRGLGGFIELLDDLGDAAGRERRRRASGPFRLASVGRQQFGVRAPVTDLFDEAGHIRITIELPGIADGDIRVEIEPSAVRIEAVGRDHSYRKILALPLPVDPATVQRSFTNAILEIRLDKR